MTMQSAHARVLRLAGGATAITAALGAFAVANAGLVHEWRICGFPVGCNYHGAPASPLPTTSVLLPDGPSVGIWLYLGLVSASGALVTIAAVVCAARPLLSWRLMLCASAALFALTVVLFRLPPPARLAGMMGPCVATGSCPTEVRPYPSAIHSIWYMAPAVALGLLTAVTGLFPSKSHGVVAPLTDRT